VTEEKNDMLITILIPVAVVVAGLAVVVARRPSEYRVARTATIAAPAPAVFAQVSDFRKWDAWNPWARLDPATRQTYEGAPAGTGAIYTWAGNKEVGEGRIPFAATSTAEFTFEPAGGHTVVTWSMAGRNNFMAKAIHLVMDMDTMIGGNFEKGLADMKSVVEARRGA
jgi:hypothetical protein